MKKFIFALAVLLVAALQPVSADARDWDYLARDPLQDASNPEVIRTVLRGFAVLRTAGVADELVELVIANRGSPSTVCKGDVFADMSSGRSHIWGEPAHVVWKNVAGPCKPATLFEVARGPTVYAVKRIHACRNLAPLFPRRGPAALPPTGGPILGLAPPAECPTCC